MKPVHLCLGILLVFLSCGRQSKFEIKEFDPYSNYTTISDTLDYTVDLTNAVAEGMIIPTRNGNEHFFVTSFHIRNNGRKEKNYCYKVFYQNESYAHDLFIDQHPRKGFNPEANSNFYGSWNRSGKGFHSTGPIQPDGEFVEITDTITILGNPRDEAKYFGGRASNPIITEAELEAATRRIRAASDWMAQIRKKAELNSISVDRQVELDARWVIMSEKQKGNENNRWKRNPRTGIYSFLLVVMEEKDLDRVPYYYRDVTLMDSVNATYQNPYCYYLSYPGEIRGCYAGISRKTLKVTVKYVLSSGIYVNTSARENLYTDYLDSFTGNSDSLYYHAQLEQYFHNIDKKTLLRNIPLARDLTGDGYSLEDYRENASKYSGDALTRDHLRITEHPGRTVGFDRSRNAVYLKNPGNPGRDGFRKENVGLQTRHGLTYGKYRARIQFPEILSDDGVWNGITCACWMIFQHGNWNARSNCMTGYNPKLYSDSVRSQTSTYSEIDIEIVKTSKYWPRTSYGGREDYPVDSALNKNVILSCTNWDLACHDPDSFNIGVRDIEYEGTRFNLHRWDDDYRALTSKFEFPHDSAMGKTVYYEIEWRPDRITWRIGPSKDNMQVFGTMDEQSTMIPDNQMVMVFTQEFHAAEWWPLTPFRQEMIPYPLNDLTGYIYEIEVE